MARAVVSAACCIALALAVGASRLSIQNRAVTALPLHWLSCQGSLNLTQLMQ